MKSMIAQVRADLASPCGDLDPVLLAARILLYVLLVGLIIGMVMSVVGLLTFVAGNANDLLRPPSASIWVTPSRLIVALIALGLLVGIVTRLLAMIGTVERKDSLSTDNADRIEQIAGSMLGLQLLGFFGRMIGIPVSGHINGFDLGVSLSPGGVAVVLLLFILARVFRQGATMRDDLEGTV